MEKEALKRIFEFIEEKGEHNAPFLWKHINNIPLTEKDLNFNGDLNLTDSKIKSLPEGLKFGGDLYLDGSYVESLPKGLKVGGDLYLDDSSVHSIPKGLEVYGDLYIANTLLTKYSNKQLRDMVKPGFIKGEILRE